MILYVNWVICWMACSRAAFRADTETTLPRRCVARRCRKAVSSSEDYIYIYIYMYMYVYIYIYVYICIERERERD